MRKNLFLAGIAMMVGTFASCSGSDDDNTTSWYVDKNLTTQDIADHYYEGRKVNIHVTAGGTCMQVWRKDNTGGVGSNDFTIDGDSIRFKASGVAFRAHLVRYGEGEPLSLVLGGDDDAWLPGGLTTGIYKQVK